MVNPAVYAAAGLDPERAKREAAASEHRRTMMRTSSGHLMQFLSERRPAHPGRRPDLPPSAHALSG